MPTNPSRLVNIIKNNRNKRVKATDIVNSIPKLTTVASKLIKSNTNNQAPTSVSKMDVNKAELEKIYERMKSVKENNENIIKLFPDIELSIQILVSSILSPKNMIDTYLNYKLDKAIASPSVTTSMLEVVKNHLTSQYKLEAKLPEMVREALFEKGGYVLAIIPESAVDEIINGDIINHTVSTEKYRSVVQGMTSTLGILDNSNQDALYNHLSTSIKENIKILVSQENFLVTDNYNLLKFPTLRERVKSKIIHSKLRGKQTSLSLEDIDYFNVFRNSQTTIATKNVSAVKTKDETTRTSLGAPLVVKLSTEAVIPIFTPGDPSNHIGYFVLLDENGYPVSSEITSERMVGIQKNLAASSTPMTNNQSQMSITQKAVNNLIGDQSTVGIGAIYNIYKDLIEKQIYDKVKKSLYGSNVELSNKNDIYFTMFTRSLANQKTSLLFIPSELVTYVAFSYNKNGTGRTLLENLSVLTSLRAIMLFAKVMAYAKSSIDVTKVNVTLDPNDPDPEKTIEEVMDGVLKMRQNYFPLGINNPTDLTDWIQRSGLQFTYENHPGLPNVKLDFESSNLEHTIPSDELEEIIRKQTIMSLGLSPETVDNGFSPEFATTIVNNNILLSKRILVYQSKLEVFLKKIAHDIITNDEELRYLLQEELKKNISEVESYLSEKEKALYNQDNVEFFEHLIDKIALSLKITLPKPEATNLTNMTADFDLYKESLEKVLSSIVSSEIFSEDVSGELSSHVDSIANVYKHHLLRKWMSENNFLPEAFEIMSQTEETEEKLDLNKSLKNHIESIMLSSGDLLNKLKASRAAMDRDLGLAAVGDLAGGEETTSSSSDEGSSDEGGSDDMGGMDDFGVDMGAEDGGTEEKGAATDKDVAV